MSSTVVFSNARELIELTGLFMLVLPILSFSAISLALYFKRKN